MKRPALWLLCACWMAILLAPPLRRMLFIQLSGKSAIYQSWIYGPALRWPQWEPSPIKLREHFPDDPRVLALALEEWNNPIRTLATLNAEERSDLRKYDDLIRRFPRDNWLIARRLQKTLFWMGRSGARIGGELSDSDLYAHKAAGIPSPEKSKSPLNINFTPQDVENAIAMARLGQKREPDNAFFDEMHFYLLMMDWRDDEAWRVLSKASRKTDYNQHRREWKLANIAQHELELGRPLLFEEKSRAEMDSSFPLDAYARELARIVVWEGIKAGRRRGYHHKALQIYTDYARLQDLHARQSYDIVESHIARALVSLTLGIESQPSRAELPLRRAYLKEAWARVSAYKFARYATKHGRPDLAREMAQLRISGARLQDKLLAGVNNPNLYNGMPPRLFIRAMSVWWAAISLLLWLTLLGTLWAMLGVLLRVLSLPAPFVAHRDLMTVGIAILTTALCFGVALWVGLGWQTTFLMGAVKETDSELGENLSCLLLSGVILPPLLVSLWCWCVTLRRAERRDTPDEPPLWRERWRAVRLIPLANGAALLLLLGGSLLWWMAVMVKSGGTVFFPAVFGLVPPGPGFTIAPVHPLWPLSLFAFSLLALWARPIFGAAPREKPFLAYRLRWLHESLGVLCVVGSVAYFLLLVASVPLRAAADAEMDQLLQRGEVALIIGGSGGR